ncbi:bifunctional DNA-formamidopyrimidine glycosylase/DNA-(apurinic or apyrimidinic site) lyase [Brachybacterium sp. J153]|uniref:bifunctional DNA-formamidopyrimidine glycosylase/DNA-(apurinic or apyrimidinic site) lyase n=1 Tax=Brachybacterium sp. J153 TaxID=3116488 RepID=UPI002E7680F5|nr:bifunctional DNA-formamidopyrimidine glycosylase/DNA-(apurinic or apyrimidinic site) lyase [Brachybacterium sp. J153]MEE1617175.1 bifunctional DNA-formamidopyrimidine glycosylase/DNA-(apurinic or apyrimidinic site) lyase [Brachybacterium sp. J153]
MPELPEVEVVRRGLAPRTVGRTITALEVLDARSLRRQDGGEDRLRALLVGRSMTAAARRGKFLWWRLAEADGAESGEALLAHLGMSGQLRLVTPGGPDPQRHRRVSLTLDDGARVDFIDQRLFGGLWSSDLVEAADGRLAALGSPDALLPVDAAHIARDLLDPALDLAEVARTLRGRRRAVKSLLLDQGIVSGIGNIYADEALWAARVRYDPPGSALSQRTALALLRAARAVMERALDVGGTSFDALYVNAQGEPGYFARSLAAYGREGEPCRRCGRFIERAISQGRSSHYCPRCQRSTGVTRKDAE